MIDYIISKSPTKRCLYHHSLDVSPYRRTNAQDSGERSVRTTGRVELGWSYIYSTVFGEMLEKGKSETQVNN